VRVAGGEMWNASCGLGERVGGLRNPGCGEQVPDSWMLVARCWMLFAGSELGSASLRIIGGWMRAKYTVRELPDHYGVRPLPSPP
jgi:hypothetical protein